MRTVSTGLRVGLLFGTVLIFTVLVGFFNAFAEAKLAGVSIPLWMLVLFGLWCGHIAARRGARSGQAEYSLGPSLVAGAVGGLTAGFLLAAFTSVIARYNLREAFENIVPATVEILTLGAGVPAGLVWHVVGGTVVGSIGALAWNAGRRLRTPAGWQASAKAGAALALGLYVALGSLSALLATLASRVPAVVPLAQLPLLRLVHPDDLYRVLRLTLMAVGAGGAAGTVLLILSPDRARRLARQVPVERIAVLSFLLMAIIFPLTLGSYWNQVLTTIGIFVMMGLGLNVVVGFAGLLDLGYVAFFAIGAYTYAFLNSPKYGLSVNFWIALPIAMAAAALAGILLGVPVLRMRGDYLAIVTLGFGEIIRLVLNNQVELTGGPQGILEIRPPQIFSFLINSPVEFYYMILVGAVLVAFVTARLNHSRIGRAWIAMREDEDVARAMGINTVNYKLLAFAVGASFAGIAGMIFAARQRSIFPADFGLLVSIEALSLIIIGGMGSIPGVIAGAVVLKGLPELLRALQEYRLLLYGALLVIMMLIRPEGLWPSRRRAREIHELMDESQLAVEPMPAAPSPAAPPPRGSTPREPGAAP
ncbi:MAG: leucine/isoleucine/valine transporter permease subunit [Ardenticatenia bacterium]|nr:leucine/isoleucine/valine transporter permease subunit [Ardenticatenia bacterium]